ncbi:DUF4391 domain-containing protein [Bifidobacterium sp. ESL0790]|uniref:DUF4391 domain-containing protein n=1 Tax=Bifidobacterium sp. ESL0790 TaxID=2983233 RepID=UPI0023FA2D98|nr:DUF4391 domain-containing protein [Bifidobacterium sp. ESL0790]WEV72764.1 DUF4391 domain-containing protein [Bifidobacterium sp. ESL0790]
MTVAHCGSVSAPGLGLPASCAIAEAKGTLPKQMFYARGAVSSRLKQRFINDIESITMLALLRPETIHVEAGAKVREILVIGLRQLCAEAPVEVMEHIARLRSASNILFVCVRDGDGKGAAKTDASANPTAGSGVEGQQCLFALQHAAPAKAGRQEQAQATTFTSPWMPTASARLTVNGSSLDEVWQSLSAQVILGDEDGENLDERIATQARAAQLSAQIEKLEGDHQRAKTPAKRNEIYAKLHKARTELENLQKARG